MKAEVLKPQVLRPVYTPTPQCEGDVHINPYLRETKWREERYKKLRPHFDPMKCQHESVYKLDGKCLCKKHAGMYCLEKWENGGLTSEPTRNAILDEAIEAIKEFSAPEQLQMTYVARGPGGILAGACNAIRNLKTKE